jgi:DNA invertase Pin-like site-specific DNA recombinase
MSKSHVHSLELTGTGAGYVRCSTDQQDTQRQYAAIHAFEKRHGVSIKPEHLYRDEGWARDTADERPDFQRMVKLAESGRLQWIVVDALDRFGMKSSKQLMSYLYRLEQAGCRLFDVSGKEWTSEDDATEITALIAGKQSVKEQRDKSHRVLAGKIEKARRGEFQGGIVRLGFDVGCFHRETGKELWRVVFEGVNRRLKVYPDGHRERFDGDRNFPAHQTMTEVLRVTPSKDQRKMDAAVSVFRRYATESISFAALAHYLNKFGLGSFHGQHVLSMLSDPVYLGYATFNKIHHGKFSRYQQEQLVAVCNWDEKGIKNDRGDWVLSQRLFPPLVDQKTWDQVQRKLTSRQVRGKAPKSAALYLAGLVYCANCGSRMVAGPISRGAHYFCGSYFKAVRQGKRGECSCLRNAIWQSDLERYLDKYLEETHQRLLLWVQAFPTDPILDRLKGQEESAWSASPTVFTDSAITSRRTIPRTTTPF